MDAPKQTLCDPNNTSISMYLSFDSSICSAAYKTMENTTHELSKMDYEETTSESSQGPHQDSTLEALDSHIEYLESVKERDMHLPHCTLPKRVLQQCNVVSSTPTKEQLLRSVEVVRGSGAERCLDLTSAFLDMDPKDKENALPQTKSIALEQQIVPLNDKNQNNKVVKNIGSSIVPNIKTIENEKISSHLADTHTNKKGLENLEIVKANEFNNEEALETILEEKDIENVGHIDVEGNVKLKSIGNESFTANIIEKTDLGNMASKGIMQPKAKATKMTATNPENKDPTVIYNKHVVYEASVVELSNSSNNKKTLAKNAACKDPTLSKTKRLSIAKQPICEPNLLTNRPSRIATNVNKRLSVNGVGMQTKLEREISTEIPKLMNKVLKFAESTTVEIDKAKTAAMFDKHKPISNSTKALSSILPSTALSHAEKRPFAYTHRMSVLVKTTLNSPARKIARRSCATFGQQNIKNLAASNAPSRTNRKSMIPVERTAQTVPIITNPTSLKQPLSTVKTQKSTAESTNTKTITNQPTKIKPVNRKSLYPSVKQHNDLHKPPTVSSTLPANIKLRQSVAGNIESSYICNFCGTKFSIKSLLDAHKRSHEWDGMATSVRKPLVARTSTNNVGAVTGHANGTNQCKYCDKKFALLRALHIHLLQNCSKIPPKDKRKLTFHEMDHVEKAHLPPVFQAGSAHVKVNLHEQGTNAATAGVLYPNRSASDLSSISISSTDSSINDKRALGEITMIANTAAATVDSFKPEMAPPSARIVKKSTAHSGVHRTPNKLIMCHTCKMSFKTIMDHIKHNMEVHFNNGDIQKLK